MPAAVARDPERLARFEREAKVLASLNHPNIAQIYGVEESRGSRALVMELVDGATLSVPQPLEAALNYAKQIADALEAAHEKGITHRDLKPANIMVTPAGIVKVLDFGLAAPSRERDAAVLILNPIQAVPICVVWTARASASRNLFLGLAGPPLAWVVGADKELSPVREREISGAGPG